MTITELQFQKRIPNDKNEVILQFNVIKNLFTLDGNSNTQHIFTGEVVVNVTAKKYYISPFAKKALRDKYDSSVLHEFEEKIKALSIDERMPFRYAICDERIEKMLFEECEKLSKVIC